MITQFEDMMLPITEFRHKMTQILDNLITPKILMNRDKPKAVIVPYEIFKSMELALEDQMDDILVKVAEDRINESKAKYVSHDDFWDNSGAE